ncbi:hypothetical protein [Alkaliphilus sp. B6464]|uniref:hypothetical protein n=1 Tax=Alkaliphilus sp. B6464 TaxID=2731219 RepID=UPI001BA7C794|nr:hypothetical protein [Alkaliphilus sp. B6464]QUH21982.1 hypothetical protein HYG84_18935 [Alkaliphilus sp. B6464]
MKKLRRKGFIITAELILLTVIISIAAILVFSTTTKTMQDNFDTETKTKLQRDLWTNQ